MAAASLRGACSCGRNQYLIDLPEPAAVPSLLQVCFDDRADSRRSQSSPLPIFLRVPLSALQSTTYAFYPNEVHAQIRRSFTPRAAPHIKRYFCGFCGTPLSLWSEASDRAEADWINVTLSTLEDDSLELLDQLGVLPTLEDDDNSNDGEDSFSTAAANGSRTASEAPDVMETSPARKIADLRTGSSLITRSGDREIRGQPWFEEIISNSPLGRLKQRRGGNSSQNGAVTVEWEVIEYPADVDETEGPSKRKIGEMAGGEEVSMRGGA